MKKSSPNHEHFPRDLQYAKFSAYGFLKNLRFFEPFLVLFFLEKGLSFLEIGTLYAVREIVVNVLEIPSGALADALGRRRTMIASFISYLISFVIFWRAASLPIFVVAILAFSFGEAFRTGTHKAMIFTYLRLNGYERFKTDYYGHTRGWSQIGSAISSVIAAAIVFVSGNYTAIFLFSTIPYILDLALMFTYPRELDGTRTGFSLRSVGNAFREIGRSLVSTIRQRGALRAVVSSSLYGGFYKGTKDYLQPLIIALAVSVPLAVGMPSVQREALFVGVIYMVIYFLTAYSSRRSARVSAALRSPERAMNWELTVGLFVGLGIGITRVIGWTGLPVVLFLVIYVIQNMRRPVSVAVVSERIPEEILATMLSVESQIQSLIAAVAALMIGAVANVAAGSVGSGILVVSALGLLAVPFVWLRPRTSEASVDL